MTCPRWWRLAFSSIRLATFLSFVAALVLIAPIAFASPPDPSWIAGIFDGADGDDVVTLVYETAASSAPALAPIGPFSSSLAVPTERIIFRLSGRQFGHGPRAPPPSSVSIVFAHVLTFLVS